LANNIEGENIIKVIRRDIFIMLKKVFMFLLMAALPVILFYLLASANPQVFENQLVYPLLVLGASIYYLYVWLFFFFAFIDYYLDIWIITDKRIIDIQQKGFFSRVISEHKISKIQDVTSETHGVVGTVFGFGDVHIQTAAAKQRFHFDDVPDPNGVRDSIISLIEKNKINDLTTHENQ
jgi:hypothetical protein